MILRQLSSSTDFIYICNLLQLIISLSKKRYYIKNAGDIFRWKHINIGHYVHWQPWLEPFIPAIKTWKRLTNYFACSSLLCMIMAIYSGHKMISDKSRKKKDSVSEENVLCLIFYDKIKKGPALGRASQHFLLRAFAP